VSNLKTERYNYFMLVNFAVGILGLIIFLFIFWKRLKEDYASEVIFRVAIFILLGLLTGWLLAVKLRPDVFLWSAFLGASLGLGLAVFSLKLRFYETLEAFIISVFPWLALFFLKDSVVNSSLSSFLAFLAVLLFVFISYYFDANYKHFSWYKSGKIGFAGLSTLGIMFIVRSAIASFGITMLSFVDKFESIVSGAAAFICFLLLFNLGRTQ
jgi:hypothetical protein